MAWVLFLAEFGQKTWTRRPRQKHLGETVSNTVPIGSQVMTAASAEVRRRASRRTQHLGWLPAVGGGSRQPPVNAKWSESQLSVWAQGGRAGLPFSKLTPIFRALSRQLVIPGYSACEIQNDSIHGPPTPYLIAPSLNCHSKHIQYPYSLKTV